jgi:hypothetical protein
MVKAFDELGDGGAGFGLGLEALPGEELALQRGEEALGHGVVVASPTNPSTATLVSRQPRRS